MQVKPIYTMAGLIGYLDFYKATQPNLGIDLIYACFGENLPEGEFYSVNKMYSEIFEYC